MPGDRKDPASREAGQVSGPVEVTGLLRLTEPGGAFLRSNDPAGKRWYSRDVAAIAAARGLTDVAPYFVDAARPASESRGLVPIGGLTVVAIHQQHTSSTRSVVRPRPDAGGFSASTGAGAAGKPVFRGVAARKPRL